MRRKPNGIEEKLTPLWASSHPCCRPFRFGKVPGQKNYCMWASLFIEEIFFATNNYPFFFSKERKELEGDLTNDPDRNC